MLPHHKNSMHCIALHCPSIFCSIITAKGLPHLPFHCHHLSLSTFLFISICLFPKLFHAPPSPLPFLFLLEDFTVSCGLFACCSFWLVWCTFVICHGLMASTCFVRFYLLRFMFFFTAKKKKSCSFQLINSVFHK